MFLLAMEIHYAEKASVETREKIIHTTTIILLPAALCEISFHVLHKTR